jgi:hypothetical protein
VSFNIPQRENCGKIIEASKGSVVVDCRQTLAHLKTLLSPLLGGVAVDQFRLKLEAKGRQLKNLNDPLIRHGIGKDVGSKQSVFVELGAPLGEHDVSVKVLIALPNDDLNSSSDVRFAPLGKKGCAPPVAVAAFCCHIVRGLLTCLHPISSPMMRRRRGAVGFVGSGQSESCARSTARRTAR